MKFVYSHVNERDWEQEAWFELGTAKRDYEVLRTKPKIEADKVEGVLDKLNETRDLALFLKAMRELFVEGYK